MLAIIGIALLIWIGLSLLSFVLKGLFWLVILGGVLFVGATIVAWVKKRGSNLS